LRSPAISSVSCPLVATSEAAAVREGEGDVGLATHRCSMYVQRMQSNASSTYECTACFTTYTIRVHSMFHYLYYTSAQHVSLPILYKCTACFTTYTIRVHSMFHYLYYTSAQHVSLPVLLQRRR
jgi:hypothetical protein